MTTASEQALADILARRAAITGDTSIPVSGGSSDFSGIDGSGATGSSGVSTGGPGTLSSVLGQLRSHESITAAQSLGVSPYALAPSDNVDFPRSHASGAYQFQPGTWQRYTAESGIGTQYQEAYQAPANVQDAVAAYVVTKHGTGDWTPYSGQVSQVTTYDVDPYQLAANGDPNGLAGGGNETRVAGPGAGSPNMSIDAPDSFSPGAGQPNATGTAETPGAGSGVTGTGTAEGQAGAQASNDGQFASTTDATGSGTPVQLNTSSSLDSAINAITKTIGNIPKQIAQTTKDALAGAGNAVKTGVSSALSGLEEWIVRGGLLLLGTLLIVGVLVVIIARSETGQQVAKSAALAA